MASTGIGWVNDYRGRARNLKHSNNNARGFQNAMKATKGFDHGNNNAWDMDWEKGGLGRPGQRMGFAYWYAETVDIAYFAGQGSSDGPIFSVMYENGVARYDEVRLGGIYSTGARHRLKCVVFDASRVLANWSNWRSSFDGLRHIFSFSTSREDSGDRGRYFANYLQRAAYRVQDAWRRACELTEASDKKWAWLYATYGDVDTYWEKWPFSPSKKTKPTRFGFQKGSC